MWFQVTDVDFFSGKLGKPRFILLLDRITLETKQVFIYNKYAEASSSFSSSQWEVFPRVWTTDEIWGDSWDKELHLIFFH